MALFKHQHSLSTGSTDTDGQRVCAFNMARNKQRLYS